MPCYCALLPDWCQRFFFCIEDSLGHHMVLRSLPASSTKVRFVPTIYETKLTFHAGASSEADQRPLALDLRRFTNFTSPIQIIASTMPLAAWASISNHSANLSTAKRPFSLSNPESSKTISAVSQFLKGSGSHVCAG
jgi:hypothetical protein